MGGTGRALVNLQFAVSPLKPPGSAQSPFIQWHCPGRPPGAMHCAVKGDGEVDAGADRRVVRTTKGSARPAAKAWGKAGAQTWVRSETPREGDQ